MFKDPKNPQFKAARKLLRAGVITMSEVAVFAGVSRQHIHRECGDIDPVLRRHAHLRKLWNRTMRELE
jgi:hypothetical protein